NGYLIRRGLRGCTKSDQYERRKGFQRWHIQIVLETTTGLCADSSLFGCRIVEHAQQLKCCHVLFLYRSERDIAEVLRFGIAFELVTETAEADDLAREAQMLPDKLADIAWIENQRTFHGHGGPTVFAIFPAQIAALERVHFLQFF